MTYVLRQDHCEPEAFVGMEATRSNKFIGTGQSFACLHTFSLRRHHGEINYELAYRYSHNLPCPGCRPCQVGLSLVPKHPIEAVQMQSELDAVLFYPLYKFSSRPAYRYSFYFDP
eukprot:scaffold19567_cov61-Attheya_sp.AAC.3